MNYLRLSLLATALGATAVNAAVVATSDTAFDTSAPVFTVDPATTASPAARNLAGTRELRQTFQNPTTFDVAQIVLSLGVASTASGITIEIFEVADVGAANFTPAGPAVATINVPQSAMMSSTQRLGIGLTGADIFSLPQRNSGTEGYGLQLSVDDGTTNVGAWNHTNDATNHYTAGVYYSEGGTIPGATRDMGVSLSAVPEPSVALLGGLGLLGMMRRRRA